MTLVVAVACVIALLLLSALAVYQWVLAVASAIPAREGRGASCGGSVRFVVLVPAHNEETGLRGTLASLAAVRYPAHLVRVVVVADRCSDGTAAIARGCGVMCLERAEGPSGKGAAMAWALDKLRKTSIDFDALVVVDADTIVDSRLLEAFAAAGRDGHEVQQAYNYLSNPWASPFTRIIAVTSILRNRLFYGGKARLGLSAMLTGTGMYLGRRVLDSKGWTALSVGEDWEYSVSLLLAGETIHFNGSARVLARESTGLAQASTQRLRWASGRHAVAGSGGWRLFTRGVRERQLALCDAALNLAAPTYSVQATLALLCMAATYFLPADAMGPLLFAWSVALTGSLAAYFLVGVALTESPGRALAGLVLVPVFLPWRMAIEVLGLLGYGRKHWVRTSRVAAAR